jgi:hypothetical protein
MLDRLDDATALADSVLAADSGSSTAHGLVGVLAAARGDGMTAEAAEGWLAAHRRDYGQRDVTMWRARIQAQLGNVGRAVQLLGRAYTEGANFQSYHHADLFLEPLKDKDEFKEFVRPKG